MIINAPNTMILFRDDDEAYTAFLQDADNRAGFVLNTTRTPSRSFVALHRATCPTIQGAPTKGRQWTTGDYCKIWAARYEELEHWVSRNLHCTARPCGRCHPEVSAALLKGEDEIHTDTYSQPVDAAERQIVFGLESVWLNLGDFGIIEPAGIDRLLLKRRITGRGWTYWAEGWDTEQTGDGSSEDDYRDIQKWKTHESEDPMQVLPAYWPYFAPSRGNRHCLEWTRGIFRDFFQGMDDDKKDLYSRHSSLKLRWTMLFGPVEFPTFQSLLTASAESPTAQADQLVSLDGHSVPTLTAIRSLLDNCETVEAEVDAMLFSRDWRAHLVAAAAISLGAGSDKLFLCLWRAFDEGSRAMPQLAATAAYLDPEFGISVFSRLVNELASPIGRSVTGMSAILALLQQSSSAGSREEATEFYTDAAMQTLLAQDQEDGGGSAVAWLRGLRELIGEPVMG